MVYYAALHMQPAERTVVTRAGVVKDRTNPNSAAGALYGACRVLDDAGAYLPPMKEVVKVLKGLRRRMIEDFGDDALAPQQAQPWSRKDLTSMIAALENEAILGWSPKRHRASWPSDHACLRQERGLPQSRDPALQERSNVAWLTRT